MRKGQCKHFNGTTHNKCCLAGVEYRSVTGEPDKVEGSVLRIACRQLPFSNLSPSQMEHFNKRGTCAEYEEPTDQEITDYEAEELRWINQFTDRMLILEPLLKNLKRKQKGKDWSGRMDCPICKAKISLSISHAGYNGHCHVHCTTDDCVSFME